jgi:2-polyprenyl-3-methyl-5-hydroxy-6-metoxy-1,4-benzoquinol methylase
MERIPEPELMNEALQVSAYASADFSDSDSAVLCRLVELCREFGQEPTANDLLVDLGCGPGNIAERLHRQWPTSRVIGMDGAEAMLQVARSRQQSCPGSDAQLHYRKVALADLAAVGWSAVEDWSAPKAAVVISNSLLHHLHHPEMLWQATHRLACSGAVVLHRDLRRPANAEEALALRERYLPDAPDVLRHDYLASLHASFTVEEVRAQLERCGLGCLRVEAVADRYLEVSGRLV